MQFSGRKPRALLAAILPLFLTGAILQAGSPPAKSNKVPKASTQLRKAIKNFRKVKNFSLVTTVVGGLSEDPSHRVSTETVNKSYNAVVAGRGSKVMKIAQIRAYKTPKAGKGAIYYQGTWKRLLTIPKGVLADRLVKFPTEILTTAAKYGKTARWLEATEVSGGKELFPGLTAGGDDLEEDDEDEDSDGKTVVGDSKKEKTVPTPRVLRVTAPDQVALNIFNTQVVNSGCMSEG